MRNKDSLKIYTVTCPGCHKDTPAEELARYIKVDKRYSICRCNMCKTIFFVKETLGNNEYMGIYCEPINLEVYPYPLIEKLFPETITKISPKFKKLYEEAQKAEIYGLEDICGFAYRRAFEFLMRDFACYLNPDLSDEIKADKNFSNVISNRIPDSSILKDIKELSKRSWWIGSDYAHYTKSYEEFGISDLKHIIDILTLEIDHYVEKERLKQIPRK